MTVYDRIKELAQKRKMTISEVEEALGMGTNSLYAWKKKTPNGASLEKAADYFHVSVDYLLGRDSENISNGPIDLTEIANSDDEAVWDKLVSSGGRPLTEKDKAMIRLVFADRWNEITQKAKDIDNNK